MNVELIEQKLKTMEIESKINIKENLICTIICAIGCLAFVTFLIFTGKTLHLVFAYVISILFQWFLLKLTKHIAELKMIAKFKFFLRYLNDRQ